MGQAKSRIRIETAFDLSYLQSGDRNVDLKQISQRRGVSKTKWYPAYRVRFGPTTLRSRVRPRDLDQAFRTGVFTHL